MRSISIKIKSCTWLVLAFVVLIFINWLSDNVLIGEVYKVVAFESYKSQQKASRVHWFDQLAIEKAQDLPHQAAGWEYLTESQFNGKSSRNLISLISHPVCFQK